MKDFKAYTDIIPWHKSIVLFDYNQIVDWAIKMLEEGLETENLLILASFSKPVDREEIRPYVSAALAELGIEEKTTETALIGNCHYHINQILNGLNSKKQLAALYTLHLENGYDEITRPFYALHYAWCDLEAREYNYYYEGADLSNIKAILELECRKFMALYIDKDKGKADDFELQLRNVLKFTNEKQLSFIDKIKGYFK